MPQAARRPATKRTWSAAACATCCSDGRPADFDVATDARPEAVIDLFGHSYAIPTGLKHGTVTVVTGSSPPRHVEVTTFRGEGDYLDGRRPSSVTYVKSLEDDLARRDFTMNAIAFDPLSGAIADPFDGRGDLARRLVRAVGDPVARFREDGLRPMRAVRQAAQLGFEVEPPTRAAIPQTLDVFRKVSAERVRDELLKLLAAPQPSRGLELMRTTGLLGEVIPELLEGVGCTQNRFHKHDVYGTRCTSSTRRRGTPSSAWGRCFTTSASRARASRAKARPASTASSSTSTSAREMADAICRRLKLSNEERERVVGDGRQPHVLLRARLDRRCRAPLRPQASAGREALDGAVRAARGRRRGARLRRGSRARARASCAGASPPSPRRTPR